MYLVLDLLQGERGTSLTDTELDQLARRLARKMKRDHFGGDNAAGADDLVEYLGVSTDRDLRDVIAWCQDVLQEPIVATFSEGYCYATGWADDSYLHFESQRRAVAVANFKKVKNVNRAMERVYGEPRLFGVNA